MKWSLSKDCRACYWSEDILPLHWPSNFLAKLNNESRFCSQMHTLVEKKYAKYMYVCGRCLWRPCMEEVFMLPEAAISISRVFICIYVEHRLVSALQVLVLFSTVGAIYRDLLFCVEIFSLGVKGRNFFIEIYFYKNLENVEGGQQLHSPSYFPSTDIRFDYSAFQREARVPRDSDFHWKEWCG